MKRTKNACILFYSSLSKCPIKKITKILFCLQYLSLTNIRNIHSYILHLLLIVALWLLLYIFSESLHVILLLHVMDGNEVQNYNKKVCRFQFTLFAFAIIFQTYSFTRIYMKFCCVLGILCFKMYTAIKYIG